jgi:methionyl-tRNA formyltransferase
LKIVFLGTPAWAALSLRALVRSRHEVIGVVTQPDRPVGRSREPVESPVKQAAAELGLPAPLQPASLRQETVRREILRGRPEALVVVAYGRILPGRLIDAPPRGAINLHFSLLPRHRGASPVQHTILAGDVEAGVTTILMDRGLDTGPILLQQRTCVGQRETAPELGDRLARLGAPLLVETLDRLADDGVEPRPQDEAAASLAPLLTRDMGSVRWERPAAEIERMTRAFARWPPVVARAATGRLRILVARATPGRSAREAPAGQVLGLAGDGVEVACGASTVLRIEELQPDSRRSMSGRAALAGRYLRAGERLRDGEEG